MKQEKTAETAKAKTGRPRTFDADEALDCAMKVFWEKGYEGSSLPELTKAMGMNRPSLYAVFGNKEQLFHKALERYSDTRMRFFDAALEQPTARQVVEALLTQYVDAQTMPDGPHGCMGVNAALACSDDALPIRDELFARRLRGEIKLRDRLRRAREEGDLPPDSCPEQQARFVVTLSQGMAIQAAAGVSREQLQQMVGLLLRNWPM